MSTSCTNKLYGSIFPVYTNFYIILSSVIYCTFQLSAIYVGIKLRNTLTTSNKLIISVFSLCLLVRYLIMVMGWSKLSDSKIEDGDHTTTSGEVSRMNFYRVQDIVC